MATRKKIVKKKAPVKRVVKKKATRKNSAKPKSLFFNFNQNNSGGRFTFDEKRGISVHVVVEALDYSHANARAQNIGLYFDGSADCPCCGNRWYAQYDGKEGTKKPSIYDEPVKLGEKFKKGTLSFKWMGEGKPEGFVHFLDGRIEGFGY